MNKTVEDLKDIVLRKLFDLEKDLALTSQRQTLRKEIGKMKNKYDNGVTMNVHDTLADVLKIIDKI